MNVLFVSLTRFGDLLQTQASITDAALAGHTVGVVCLQNFLPPLHLMQHVEHVFPFIGSSLLAQLSFSEDDAVEGLPAENADGWLKATKELAHWREMLWREFPPDVVIALSPAQSSRLLTKYIAKDAVVGGFSVDSHGTLYNSNFWASLMQGVSFQRGIIPYNLVDIFRAITAETLSRAAVTLQHPGAQLSFAETKAHYGDNTLLPLPPAIVSNTFNDLDRGILAMGFTGLVDSETQRNPDIIAQLAAKAGTKNITGFVGMQLGASATQRQWPLKSFARVANYLWAKYRLVPVLLGAKNEVPLAKDYESLTTTPSISMVGKTGVVDLGALLSHCLFLLTNDTGTMHLAAGLDIPSFAIFLATAQPFDTGPYLPGCYCFEPDLPCHPCNFNTPCPHDFVCRHAVRPETVTACIEHFLNNSLVNKADLDGARVWLTAIDDKGVLSLEAFNGEDNLAENVASSPGTGGQKALMILENAALEETALYAASRDNLVKLQRVLAWGFANTLAPCSMSRQGLEEGQGAFGDVPSPLADFDASSLPPLARARMAEDASRIAAQLEVLAKQGEVLLLRSVELMQKRFLQSWEGVSSLLEKSPWFCFLHSPWVDLTQAREAEFTEIMAVIGIFRDIFSHCATMLQDAVFRDEALQDAAL